MSGSSTPAYQIRYKYNDQGYRTSKAFYTFSGYTPVLTETVTYELIDDKVIYETNGTYGILFTYDFDGTLISFNYDSNVNDQYAGTEYFYLRNQMGDISHIVDSFGNVVVHYVYDAYGNITNQTPNQTIGDINPYRYRGYRYDEELSWYYLNSRYYTPEVGRFINADGLLGQFGDILSTNMFAYCANNPVMYTDSDGEFAIFVFLIVTIMTTLAVHGAMKAYETAKDLGSEGWELAGYTASGIILGDYLPVKDNWDEISSTIIPNPDPNIDMIDFYFDLEGNSFYSCYTAGLYANYLKNTYYSNNSRRTELGMYIELQGHYIAYDLGLFPDHSNPAALGVPVWGSDPTAFIAESLAEILYGISNLSPIY
ncbi:MAG: RHS repeat-associated core domain-containing protein [Candidatus Izemoplasmatales bacterium]